MESGHLSIVAALDSQNVTTWSQDYIHITRRPKKNVKGAKSAVFLEKTAVKAIPEVILKNT